MLFYTLIDGKNNFYVREMYAYYNSYYTQHKLLNYVLTSNNTINY